MAKTKTKSTVLRHPEREGPDVPPAAAGAAPPPGEAAAAASGDPASIAAGFKEAVRAVEAEQNVALKATGARAPGTGPSAPGVVPPPPTSWTPQGVGRAGVHLTNMLLGAGDFELLEKEEEQGLAEDVAYYLNARWPTGSAYEPELRLVGRFAEVVGPRFAARWKAQRDEAVKAEREAEELASAGDRDLGVPVVPKGKDYAVLSRT